MRKVLLSLSASLALLLSGCAQIPTDSLVQIGTDIQSGVTSDYTYYSPSGPTKGDGQTEILNGFLSAFTGPQSDYQVAREFLVDSLAATWEPNKKLLIENSRPTISFEGTDTAKVVVNAVASVDELGHYVTLANAQPHTFTYKFTKENSEWRISSAPNATVLVRPVFDVLFKSYNLYFYDKQGRYLIPDLRWFPTRQSTGTRLVSALLAGPSDWLAQAAYNSFPNGTKLALESVPISAATAVVDLNSVAAKANSNDLQHMLAQLNATLTQITEVYSSVIRINHVPQSIAELPYNLALSDNMVPYILDKDGLASLSGSNPLAAVAETINKIPAIDFAVNDQMNLVALQTISGISLVKNYGAKHEPLLLDLRPGLLRPAIDPQGYTFTLGSAKGATLKAYDENGKVAMVVGDWLAKYAHLGFAISKEGSRIAFTLRDGDKSSVIVAAIVRDYEGKPLSIGKPHVISHTQLKSGAVGWVGENSLGLVTAVDGLVATPTVLTVGGDSKTLTPIAALTELVAGDLNSGYWALDSHGTLWQLRSFSWQLVRKDVKQLHF